MSVLGRLLSVLSSILTILLTCLNSDTLLCYSNEPFLTVHPLVSLTCGCNLLWFQEELLDRLHSYAHVVL